MRHAARRLLAVFAHPDDEAYACAGALARIGADPDGAAVLLCLTSGEASTVLASRGLSRDAIAAEREDRLRRVQARLGIDDLILPRLPDGQLVQIPLDRLTAPIREVLERFQPHVVVTGDARGVNGHPDHIAAHWGVRMALQHVPGARLAMTAYLRDTTDAAEGRLMFPTREDEVDVVLDLTPGEAEAKEDALHIHEGLITVRDASATDRLYRPPIERFDLWGEDFDPPRPDLFSNL